MTDQPMVSLGRSISNAAEAAPERAAIIFRHSDGRDEIISFQDLDRRSNQAARLLAERGVDSRSRVALALPNSIAYYIATYAIWKLGACVFPIRSDLPAWERERLFSVAQPSLVIGNFDGVELPQVRPAEFANLEPYSAEVLPDIIPNPYRMNATGGSTGVPKIVVQLQPGLVGVGFPHAPLGLPNPAVHLICGPLYHFGPARNSHAGLQQGHTLILLEKFDAAVVMETIAAYRVNALLVVPTMLYRIVKLPGVERYDTSSLVRLAFGAAHCADWVWERAIEIFGADVLSVSYGGTEAIGVAVGSGREWLAHRGTCGRPFHADFRIQDPAGTPLPARQVGEIWMRPHGGFVTRYLGEPMRQTADGYATLGDLGWMDEDGYVYYVDRRKDLIVSGGANVYPAEVEAVLSECPLVSDSAVIGVPDDEWGARVHAVVVLAPGAQLDQEALKAFCRTRLAAYKIPTSFSSVDALPRDGFDKMRRSAIVANGA